MTPSSLILGSDVNLLDTAPHASESETMKKRTKNINGCKEALWKRWKHDYLVTLREKHSLKHEDKTFKINVGNVVMIKGEEKNRGHWKIGIVNLYIGKEDIIQVAQLRIGKKLIDRPIQLHYPLDLYCEGVTTINEDEKKHELNTSAMEFCPKRTAAEIPKWRLKDIAVGEDDGGIW